MPQPPFTSCSAPATSANLGPGFDALALAIDLRLTVSAGSSQHLETIPTNQHLVGETHPAAIAYRSAGGDATHIWVGGPVPSGRGLGYSAAARVAGAACALVEQGQSLSASREAAYKIAAELEGHSDNAAAATFGGIVIAAPGGVIPVTYSNDLEVLVWIPANETSTSHSRTQLPASIDFKVAADAIVKVAALIAALGGDLNELRHARGDLLHEPYRFEHAPNSLRVRDAFLEMGAPHAYLSGSGPTVAALGTSSQLEQISEQFPSSLGGRLHRSKIEPHGLLISK